MVNRVILVGNMTRDAEIFSGGEGPDQRQAMTKLRLATNHVWRDGEGQRQESSEFHTVVAFGRLAEICAEYATRGRRIYIEGRLRTREYEGKDGLRRTSTEVIADTMKLLDRPPQAPEAAEDPSEIDTAESPAAVAG